MKGADRKGSRGTGCVEKPASKYVSQQKQIAIDKEQKGVASGKIDKVGEQRTARLKIIGRPSVGSTRNTKCESSRWLWPASSIGWLLCSLTSMWKDSERTRVPVKTWRRGLDSK